MVLTLDPTDAATWVNLGVAREALGDSAGARAAYGKGIEFAPEEDLAYARLAGLHLASRRPGDALRVLNQGVEQAPRSFLLRFQRAALLMQGGRLDDATRDVHEARRLEPDNPDGLRLEQALIRLRQQQQR